jgi:hypothetical protein
VVPKLCTADPRGTVISFQGICGYISVMVVVFKLKECFVKNSCVIYLTGNEFISYDW